MNLRTALLSILCACHSDPPPPSRTAPSVPAGRGSAATQPITSAPPAPAPPVPTITADAGSPRDRDWRFDGNAIPPIRGLDLAPCRTEGSLRGAGHVRVTYAPSGEATHAVVDVAPFKGTAIGACIERAFERTSVAPFGGTAPVTIGKSFALN